MFVDRVCVLLQELVESEQEDPEVAFLKSLSEKQKKKLLKYV